jgi:hypothetical protein
MNHNLNEEELEARLLRLTKLTTDTGRPLTHAEFEDLFPFETEAQARAEARNRKRQEGRRPTIDRETILAARAAIPALTLPDLPPSTDPAVTAMIAAALALEAIGRQPTPYTAAVVALPQRRRGQGRALALKLVAIGAWRWPIMDKAQKPRKARA